MDALPCCHWFLACGVLTICAENPYLPEDGAFVRIEQEMWGVFTLCPFRQGGGGRPRNAQIEEEFPPHGVVLFLDVDVVRRSKVWWKAQRLWCRPRG